MLNGSCHCGTVKWTYKWTYAADLESVTACHCTLCRRYGALWAYGHPDKIQKLPIDHLEGLVTFEDLPRDNRCAKDLWY